MPRTVLRWSGGLGVALVLAACVCAGLDAWRPARAPQVEAHPAFRVAMVFPGAPDDGSWNTSGRAALQRIERELGAAVQHFESPPGAPGERELFRRIAREGHRLVIGVSGGYSASLEQVADEFPATRFMVVSAYPGNNRNFGSVTFRESEMGYLAGVVAGMKTRSRRVAYVAGVLYPNQKERGEAFGRGARSIDPRIQHHVVEVGSWSDAQRALARASEVLDMGADVLAVDVDGAGHPIHREAARRGVHTLGWAQDQHALAPDTVLTSAVQRLDDVVVAGARMVRNGSWQGRQYRLGLREGAQHLAPFRGSLTPAEEAHVWRVQDDILRGKLDVER